MDLIGSLVSQLGVDRGNAEGAAGSIFNLIKEHAPAPQAQDMLAKIPEAGGWMQTAASAPAAGGGGLLGGLGSALGGAAGPAAMLTSALGRFGIGGDKLGVIVPLVVQFLQARLGANAGNLLASVPFLKDLGGSGASGGVGGLVGSLFGK